MQTILNFKYWIGLKIIRGWVAWSVHDGNKQAATLAALSRNAKVPINFYTTLYPYNGSKQPVAEINPILLRSNGKILDASQAKEEAVAGMAKAIARSNDWNSMLRIIISF